MSNSTGVLPGTLPHSAPVRTGSDRYPLYSCPDGQRRILTLFLLRRAATHPHSAPAYTAAMHTYSAPAYTAATQTSDFLARSKLIPLINSYYTPTALSPLPLLTAAATTHPTFHSDTTLSMVTECTPPNVTTTCSDASPLCSYQHGSDVSPLRSYQPGGDTYPLCSYLHWQRRISLVPRCL